MTSSNIKTLVLHAKYTDVLSYFDDWLEAFLDASDFNTTSINICRKDQIKTIQKQIKDYEFIVLLHSTNGDTLDFIKPYQKLLSQRNGKLMTFIGNELNYPPPLLGMRDKIACLQEIEPDFIATQLPLSAGKKLYADIKKTKVISMPHALNTKRFCCLIPQSQRPIDIGARSHRYYPFLGDDERGTIIDYFCNNNSTLSLSLDISTDYNKRFSPDEWAMFLNKCKGTLSTEAGGYYLEKDDRTVVKIAEYIKNKCGKLQRYTIGSTASKCKTVMPGFMKPVIKKCLDLMGMREKYFTEIYYSVDFKEIYEKFFKDYKNPLNGKCISSRHFDAIGTKTCQIMFPGRFNDILKEDKHYLALKHDFSNIQDAMERFRDLSYRQKMVDETYEYIMSCHTYKHRIATIAKLLGS